MSRGSAHDAFGRRSTEWLVEGQMDLLAAAAMPEGDERADEIIRLLEELVTNEREALGMLLGLAKCCAILTRKHLHLHGDDFVGLAVDQSGAGSDADAALVAGRLLTAATNGDDETVTALALAAVRRGEEHAATVTIQLLQFWSGLVHLNPKRAA